MTRNLPALHIGLVGDDDSQETRIPRGLEGFADAGLEAKCRRLTRGAGGTVAHDHFVDDAVAVEENGRSAVLREQIRIEVGNARRRADFVEPLGDFKGGHLFLCDQFAHHLGEVECL